MKNIKRFFLFILLVVILGSIGYVGYQQNWFGIHNQIVQEIRSRKVQVDDRHKKIYLNKRQQIKQRLMRETQPGLKKQGFVSVPTVGILEPVFNDAYSEKVCKQALIMRIVVARIRLVRKYQLWDKEIMG